MSGGLLGTPVNGSLKYSGVSLDCLGCDGPLAELEKEVAAIVGDEAEAVAIEPAATPEKEACEDDG
jgi:hypothetical protein